MTYPEMFLLAFALGLDAFSVALGVGLVTIERRQVFRLCWHFGLFQFLMPLVGWQAARLLSGQFGVWSSWVGAGLLFVIGARMIWEARGQRGETLKGEGADPTRGWSLIALSTATSIDALGVGFGIGLVQGGLLKACIVIGVTAFGMTWVGMRLGKMLGQRIGSFAEAFGGGVLIVLGFRMLFS